MTEDTSAANRWYVRRYRGSVEEIITYLEMTGPEQLRPAEPVPDVVLEPVPVGSPLIRMVQERIASADHWPSLSRSDRQWVAQRAHPHRWQWLVRYGTDVAGLVELEAHPGGDVELTAFGLVPEFVGQGIGGHALTLATRLAWRCEPVDAPAVTRVWLHTSSTDHPNALPNYRRRGYQPFEVKTRQHSA